MASSIENFKLDLYREHLEEASALYDLRKALIGEPGREWPSLHDFEARLEAHIDALVIGGRLALQLCAERMREGDAGELFAALSVSCRQQDASVFAEVWRNLDYEDAARVDAVTDALKFELPDAWIPACEQALARADCRAFSILATVAAYQRLPLGDLVADRMKTSDEFVNAATVSALARIQGDRTPGILQECLHRPDNEIRAHALRGLLRAGASEALRGSYRLAQTEDWPHLDMGLGGDRQAATILREQVERGTASSDTCWGLALLGDLSTVSALCACLASESLAPAAADALHWITGARLFEDAFIPEAIDERELFEAELAAWQERGEVPRRADGQPYGSTVRRVVRDSSTWNRWLTEHAAELHQNVRYRNGRPYGPKVLLECLMEPAVPARLRQLAYEELVIRYDCRVPFEFDFRVTEQIVAIRAIRQWIRENTDRFEQATGRFFLGRA
jgi:uncharacterized protein (TIGR02270 family)